MIKIPSLKVLFHWLKWNRYQLCGLHTTLNLKYLCRPKMTIFKDVTNFIQLKSLKRRLATNIAINIFYMFTRILHLCHLHWNWPRIPMRQFRNDKLKQNALMYFALCIIEYCWSKEINLHNLTLHNNIPLSWIFQPLLSINKYCIPYFLIVIL